MKTYTDARGRVIPVTPRRPGRCGAIQAVDLPPCFRQLGHFGKHISIRDTWSQVEPLVPGAPTAESDPLEASHGAESR